MNRRDILKAMAASMAVSAAPSAFAQNWAGKQFRFVVGYPAGGVVDFTARTVADGLNQITGATVIIENKAGAAGNIATEFVAKQPGDAGVFGIFGNSTLSTNPFVPQLASKTVDPYKDLKPVAAIADMILILAVTEQLGVKNLDEFLAKAKASPTPLRIGLAGIGSAHHLAALLLERSAELNLTMVPYKGGAPMIADAAGGHLDAVFTTVPVGGPMVASGKMRWIAIAQPTTIADLPGVPSLVKVYKGASIPSWVGVFAPSSTPDSLIATMHDSINQAVALPAISAKLRKNGLEPINQTLEQTNKLIAEEAVFMKKFLSEFKLDFSA
jgi:tripartite-type tricarboxylate transporter receptor subunit TctC